MSASFSTNTFQFMFSLRVATMKRSVCQLRTLLCWCATIVAMLAFSAQAQAQVNDATFVSQNVPSAMVAGQSYNVSVTMQNTGSTTWTAAEGYKLGAQNPGDNYTWMTVNRILLGTAVAPGQQYTFNFTVQAPATAGSYNFQWKMVKEYVAWFGAASSNVAVTVGAPPALVNDAGFVSQNVVASMTPGASYNVSLTMRNTGTTTWTATEGYKLGAQNPGDNYTWMTVNRILLGTAVAPGQQYTFNFTVKAPATAGSYNFQWKMVKEYVAWFGAPSNNVGVAVGSPPASGAITFFHNDVSGTPMLATNASGDVLWKETYRPYGERLNNQAGSSNNKLWFAGKPYDDNTGLSYMGARYYDPLLGRFVGIDPEDFDPGNIHSFNRYAYANNNPYKFVDPDGRQAALAWCFGGPGGCVVGVGLTAASAWYGAKAFNDTRRLQQSRSAPLKNEASDTPKSGTNSGDGGKSTNPADILTPDGKPVGENVRGAKPGVQTVPPEQLTDIIDQLKGGGAKLDPTSRYPGDWYNLPNGQGGFGVRDSKDNGRSLDINIQGVGDVTKIHQR